MTRLTKKTRSQSKPSPETETIALEMKVEPAQDRARLTIEQIIFATAELLEEVGIERISTNLVCQRAGLTPPALYRYFPNKYAILHEMGRRLMEAEDAIVFEWLKSGEGDRLASLEEQVEQQMRLSCELRQVALSQPGGVWILRVMRTVPILREVRAQSAGAVIDAIYDRLRSVWPNVDPARLRTAAILATNLSTATNELILDEPSLEDNASREFARMLALYYTDLLANA